MPAGAVRQNPQALPGIIGRKASVGGVISLLLKLPAQPGNSEGNGHARGRQRLLERSV